MAPCAQCVHRCCDCCVQVNNIIYVFGGQLVRDGSVSNELFWMTSERMEWHLQPTRGDRPVGRYGHVAVYDPDHHQLVVFGGRCDARTAAVRHACMCGCMSTCSACQLHWAAKAPAG